MALALATPLSADTVLATDFGSGFIPYNNNIYDAVTAGTSQNAEVAVGFIDPSASSAYSLTEILLPGYYGGPFDYADLSVGFWESATANLNDAIELESWNVTVGYDFIDQPLLYGVSPATSNTPTVTPMINPGNYYFITESGSSQNEVWWGSNVAIFGWQVNNLTTPQTGFYAGTLGVDGSWVAADGITPAFEVSGDLISSATPEPHSYAILCAALIGILILRRRRKTPVW